MKEFVIVKTDGPDQRVLVDGVELGSTNSVLTVEAGTHEFELRPLSKGAPLPQTPSRKLDFVVNSSSSNPHVVTFE